jgi:hypothetical protein
MGAKSEIQQIIAISVEAKRLECERVCGLFSRLASRAAERSADADSRVVLKTLIDMVHSLSDQLCVDGECDLEVLLEKF